MEERPASEPQLSDAVVEEPASKPQLLEAAAEKRAPSKAQPSGAVAEQPAWEVVG